MDASAKQLEQLTINQAQLFNVLQTLKNKPPQVTNLVMGNCPETKNLLNDSLIRFDTDKRKYTLIDGTDLPVLPFSAGGVTTYLRQQAGKTAATSNVSLVFGNANALGGQIVGITAEEYNDCLGQAATRSGKDTSARLGPYKRPDTKDRPQSKLPGMLKKPVTDSTLSASKAQDPAISKTVPPPHPINTRDGWKEGRFSKGVTMKNETRKGPSFHFTSDIQEQASVEAIERTILDQVVTLPLRDILGVSPALQKRMQEITRTRREYLTKTGEYDLYTPQAEELLAQDTSNISKSHLTHKTLYIPQTDEFRTFLVWHSNAVALRPCKLLAMTTGIFLAKLYGHRVRFMVDCGPELNIFPDRLLSLPGMTLDYEGSKWLLKGVNGGPSQLRGCSMDAEMEIGTHRFDHHFFYAARMDYDREGMMTLQLWKEGERTSRPTLSIVLTRPDDPRNVTAIHSHQARYKSSSSARTNIINPIHDYNHGVRCLYAVATIAALSSQMVQNEIMFITTAMSPLLTGIAFNLIIIRSAALVTEDLLVAQVSLPRPVSTSERGLSEVLILRAPKKAWETHTILVKEFNI
ncbi:hypothetical protein M422DRAFT_248297 [Sphaerobolus stellatus SS14]|uniref:DUF4100 domain-containing protein n=1 Tax=Sphaerobolus stellatus (strain SS14) TaxID=990650 RepID=A0A0C9W663_SPHS4|nr:hypothetical protein M422DRAFT_248297 [Sphaerobolus stellatus SS14]